MLRSGPMHIGDEVRLKAVPEVTGTVDDVASKRPWKGGHEIAVEWAHPYDALDTWRLEEELELVPSIDQAVANHPLPGTIDMDALAAEAAGLSPVDRELEFMHDLDARITFFNEEMPNGNVQIVKRALEWVVRKHIGWQHVIRKEE